MNCKTKMRCKIECLLLSISELIMLLTISAALFSVRHQLTIQQLSIIIPLLLLTGIVVIIQNKIVGTLTEN